jgi:hypothetical protein
MEGVNDFQRLPDNNAASDINQEREMRIFIFSAR